MKINNTNNIYKIIKKNNIAKKYIFNGILVSSLFLTIPHTHVQAEQICDNSYIQYSINYEDNLNKLNIEDFDNNFIKIYNNIKFLINNIAYDSDKIYLVQLEDNSVHLFSIDNIDYDLISKEKIEGKRKHLCNLRDSSCFYELYDNNLINNLNLELTNDIILEKINNWNGDTHVQTPELYAKEETKKEYKLKK